MDEILIVLVVYKCRFEESSSFQSICAYNKLNGLRSNWLVFDNSDKHVRTEYIEPDEWTKVQLQSTGRNEGLTIHYNTAFEWAEKNGFKYILLLDQDSCFSEGIAPYVRAVSEYNSPIIVPKLSAGTKLLSPSRYFLGRGFLSENLLPGRYEFKHYTPLNSGSLIQTKVWRRAGGFNNLIKLDFSDFSFFKRVQSSGIHDFLLIDYVVTHELSAFETDSTKIVTRFGIYINDMKAFRKECTGLDKILVTFWAGVHFMKVLVRTRFNINIIRLYFS